MFPRPAATMWAACPTAMTPSWWPASPGHASLNGLLHVARDDLRMTRMIEALRFVAPELEVLAFPAWDCLPYDRSSPHRDILAARIETLSELAKAGVGGRPLPVVVTTVAALLQKVPARGAFQEQRPRSRPRQDAEPGRGRRPICSATAICAMRP